MVALTLISVDSHYQPWSAQLTRRWRITGDAQVSALC